MWPPLRQLNGPARSEQLISSLPYDTPFPLSQRQTVTSRAAVQIVQVSLYLQDSELAECGRMAPFLRGQLALI